MYPLTLLGARGRKPAGPHSLQGLERRIFSCLFRLLVTPLATWAAGCFILTLASTFTWPPLCDCPLCALTRTLVMANRAHLDNPGHSARFQSLNLITSTDPLSKESNIYKLQTLGLGICGWPLFNPLQDEFSVPCKVS